MLGIHLTSIKDFTKQLFLGDGFDAFGVSEARFVTGFTTQFDGRSTAGDAASSYVAWGTLRPLAFELVKGKTLPQSFSLILIYPKEETAALLAAESLYPEEDALPGLFLNLRYADKQMTLTTGVATADFTLQRAIAAPWDQTVLNFLTELGLGDLISQP